MLEAGLVLSRAELESALDNGEIVLRYQPNRGARMLEKVLRSAMANAEDRRAPNVQSLMVVDVRVDEGPMFKRMRPRSRGMANIIKKRMSHIHLAVE